MAVNLSRICPKEKRRAERTEKRNKKRAGCCQILINWIISLLSLSFSFFLFLRNPNLACVLDRQMQMLRRDPVVFAADSRSCGMMDSICSVFQRQTLHPPPQTPPFHIPLPGSLSVQAELVTSSCSHILLCLCHRWGRGTNRQMSSFRPPASLSTYSLALFLLHPASRLTFMPTISDTGAFQTWQPLITNDFLSVDLKIDHLQSSMCLWICTCV